MNRFSSDMTTVDETISQSISQLTNTLFSVFGALVGIAVATSGTFLIIMVRDRVRLLLYRSHSSLDCPLHPASSGLGLQQDPDFLPQDEHGHRALGSRVALAHIRVLLRDFEWGKGYVPLYCSVV